MDMVIPLQSNIVGCLSIATLPLDFYLYIDNDDDCTSVLRTHLFSIDPHNDISYYRDNTFFYHLSYSNRQQIDCTIQYHEASRPFISSYQRVDTSTYQRVDTLLVRLVLIYLDTH